VTIVAARARVPASERVGRIASVIKCYSLPSQCAVTGFAARREATLMLIILRMTADAGLGRAFENLSGMT
jgi:hypothetical protein